MRKSNSDLPGIDRGVYRPFSDNKRCSASKNKLNPAHTSCVYLKSSGMMPFSTVRSRWWIDGSMQCVCMCVVYVREPTRAQQLHTWHVQHGFKVTAHSQHFSGSNGAWISTKLFNVLRPPIRSGQVSSKTRSRLFSKRQENYLSRNWNLVKCFMLIFCAPWIIFVTIFPTKFSWFIGELFSEAPLFDY